MYPFVLHSRACIMTGVGERLSPAARFAAAASRARQFRACRFRPATCFPIYAGRPVSSAPLPHKVPRDLSALIAFLRANGNDLTEAAIARAPVVPEVLEALGALPGALLARMSGSGSTCFALFATASEAQAAAAHLAAARNEWWVTPAVFGGRS